MPDRKPRVPSYRRHASGQARVTIDGIRVFRSCVTSGRDVKNAARALKYHLYFYATEADAKVGPAAREFLPITSAEFAEYKGNPSSVFRIATVAAEPVAEPVAAEAPKRREKREKVEA